MNDQNKELQEFMIPKVTDWNGVPINSIDVINVMMLIPWMEMGGADKFNLDIVKRIDRSRFSVTIVCTMQGENQWKDQFAKYCSDIHVLPEFLNIREYAEYISYLMKSRAIDVIFLSDSYYGYYALPWIKCKFPKVAVVDYVHMEEWYWRNGGYARTTGMSETFLEKTFVCNHATNKLLVEKFERNRKTVETLYIGVDEEKFNPKKVPYGKIREKYDIQDEKKVILFPCRIHPQKRPFLMVEIAKKVIEKRKDVVFFVAGDGPQYKELIEKIKKEKLQDFFVCPGEISEMEYVYRDCDLTLICSLKEGLSLTAYESCAMMTPVVTADVGGQKELIDDTVGKVLPMLQNERNIEEREYLNEEIDSYVQAIEELLADNAVYQSKCESCRAKIEDKFSTNLMIQKLEKSLEEVVEVVRQKTVDAEFYKKIQKMAENYLSTYIEYEDGGHSLKYGQNINEELKRIANSKWGKFAIQLMLKLKINKIFH